MGLRGINATPMRKRGSVLAKRPGPKPTNSRYERVVEFIEGKLKITSGPFAGQKFKLRKWQKEMLREIYATDESGKRVVRTAVITMPRKNGKTGLIAAIALAHLCGPESEPRGQVYSAAADRFQAGLLFNEMKAMIQESPELSKHVIIRDFNKHLEDTKTGSTYTALSADANTKHGLSASCIIYDELAQAPDRKLYDVLKSSTGARAEPLMIVISTQSGDPKHIMSELVDYAVQVRDGLVEDAAFYPCVYTAPEDADPWDEKTWFDCNPALDDFRSLEEMRNSALQAQRMPAREASFRLLYLNQRVVTESRFIARSDWDACGAKVDLESLEGKTCYGGLDLSGKNDLTALELVFPLDGGKVALSYFWTPADGLDEAEARDLAPYKLWVKQGHLLTTPGRVIDFRCVALKLAELSKAYHIDGIAFDRWKIDFLKRELEEIGVDIELIPAGQGFKDMDPAVQALEDDLLSKNLKHTKNPVLTWCIDNVRVTMDPAGNRKFDKRKATGRIDGAVALAMAANLSATYDDKEPQFFVLGEMTA